MRDTTQETELFHEFLDPVHKISQTTVGVKGLAKDISDKKKNGRKCKRWTQRAKPAEQTAGYGKVGAGKRLEQYHLPSEEFGQKYVP